MHIFIVAIVVATVGAHLLPSDSMFLFHDRTQYARVADFAYAIRSFQIPPVWASHFNFGIGYPIFLFYAPVAYWITSLIQMFGVGLVDSVRLSLLAGLVVGALGTYTWLLRRYAKPAAFVGSMLFVASPWFASEIFVRGNLATVWFLAFAPWSLWAISVARHYKIRAAIIVAVTLMTHNALSLIWIPVLIGYGIIGFSKHRAYRLKFLTLCVCVSGAFWIPALLQLNQTYAATIAKLTSYKDHFLCIEQIWTTSVWGFGGSTKGCVADGMSFMLGKMQIILAALGLLIGPFIIHKRRVLLFEGLMVVWALFLSLSDAQPFWSMFPPLHVIQFPWRFLSIALIFMAPLGAASVQILIEHIKIVTERDKLGLNKLYKTTVMHIIRNVTEKLLHMKMKGVTCILPPFSQTLYTIICLILGIVILMYSLKFFYGRTVPITEFTLQFASDEYIRKNAAFDVPEYVPKTVDFAYWQSFRTKAPTSSDLTKLQTDFGEFQPNTYYQLGAGILAVVSLTIIACLL